MRWQARGWSLFHGEGGRGGREGGGGGGEGGGEGREGGGRGGREGGGGGGREGGRVIMYIHEHLHVHTNM